MSMRVFRRCRPVEMRGVSPFGIGGRTEYVTRRYVCEEVTLRDFLKEVAREFIDLCRDIIKSLNPFFKKYFGVKIPANFPFKVEVLARYTPVKNIAYYFVDKDYILVRFPVALFEPSLKVIIHELVHVAQALKYGKEALLKDTGRFEEEAYMLENKLYFEYLPQKIKERAELLEAALDAIAVLLAYEKYGVLDHIGSLTLMGLDEMMNRCVHEGWQKTYPEECWKINQLVLTACREVEGVRTWSMCAEAEKIEEVIEKKKFP